MAIINSIISGGGGIYGKDFSYFDTTVDVTQKLSALISSLPSSTTQTQVVNATTKRVEIADYTSYEWIVFTKYSIVYRYNSGVSDVTKHPIFNFGYSFKIARPYLSNSTSSGSAANASRYDMLTTNNSDYLISTSINRSGFAYFNDNGTQRYAHYNGNTGLSFMNDASEMSYSSSYHRFENVPTNCPLGMRCNANYLPSTVVADIDLDNSYLHYTIEYFKLKRETTLTDQNIFFSANDWFRDNDLQNIL